MDLQQLSTPLKIAGGAGIVLFISLFLPWYSVSAEGLGVEISESGNAWEAFSLIDVLLFLAAIAAVGVAVAGAQNRMAALPVPASTLLLAVGGVAALLILYRLIDTPFDDVPDAVDTGRSWGLFVGLIAAGAIAYAGKLLQDEGTSSGAPGAAGGSHDRPL